MRIRFVRLTTHNYALHTADRIDIYMYLVKKKTSKLESFSYYAYKFSAIQIADILRVLKRIVSVVTMNIKA